MSGIYLSISFGKNGCLGAQSIEIKQMRFASIVEVRGVVGNFVHPIDELTFERRAKIEKVFGEVRNFRDGVVVGMFEDAFANFEREIEARKIKVARFEVLDDAQRLQVVIELRATRAHQFVELLFAGVAKRRMADVVHERKGLSQFRVQAESSRDGTGDLRNFESVREAIAKVVGEANREDLRLRFEPAKGAGMHDAVAVAGVVAAVRMRRLGIAAAARSGGAHGPRSECGS